MKKLVDRYDSYFDDIVELYDITTEKTTLRAAVTTYGAYDENHEETTGIGATVEIIGNNRNDDNIIQAIYDTLKDDYEETDIDYTTDYNSYINTRLYATFTTYGSPSDIDDILEVAEKLAS